MENLILLVHLVVAIAIVVLILLQQGKGAEMGASFGSGASQTLFGSGGTGNFFSRLTAVFALVFFVTSFSLAVVAKKQTTVDDPFIPTPEEVDLPALVESVSDAELPSLPVDDEMPEVVESADAEMPDSDAVKPE